MMGCPYCGENNFSVTEQVYARSLVRIEHSLVRIEGEEEFYADIPDIDYDNAITTNLMCIECGWFVDDPELPLTANLKPYEDLPDEDY